MGVAHKKTVRKILAQRRKGAKEDAKKRRRDNFASSFAPLRLCARNIMAKLTGREESIDPPMRSFDL
jgi:hypothetical protein